MISLFVVPFILLIVGIYMLSQLLIVLPLVVIALLVLYMVKLVALVPVVVLIFGSLLFFGRKKTGKRCSRPEVCERGGQYNSSKKCDMCGR